MNSDKYRDKEPVIAKTIRIIKSWRLLFTLRNV